MAATAPPPTAIRDTPASNATAASAHQPASVALEAESGFAKAARKLLSADNPASTLVAEDLIEHAKAGDEAYNCRQRLVACESHTTHLVLLPQCTARLRAVLRDCFAASFPCLVLLTGTLNVLKTKHATTMNNTLVRKIMAHPCFGGAYARWLAELYTVLLRDFPVEQSDKDAVASYIAEVH